MGKRQLFGFLLSRLILYIFLLAVVLLTALFFQAFAWSAPASDDPLPAIQKALDKGDFSKALELLAEALKDKPDDVKLLFLAAQTARRSEAFEDAEKYLKECERLKTAAEGVALERKLLRAEFGDLWDVEDELLKACSRKDNPDSIFILEALSRGYLRAYRFSRASECLNEWLKRRPDSVQALLLRADVWDWLEEEGIWKTAKGQHPKALADYQRAVELDPDNFAARLRFAESSAEPKQAMEHLERLRKAQPKNPAVLLRLARCQSELGNTDEASKLVDKVLEIDPKNVAALRERGKLESLLGEPANAEKWLTKALELNCTDAQGLYQMYLCMVQLGKEKEAKDFKTRLQKIEEDRLRFDGIVKKLSSSPKDAALYHEGGQILFRLGQERDGLRCLQLALKLDPKHRPTYATLADYYEHIGKKDLAAEHRKQAKPDSDK